MKARTMKASTMISNPTPEQRDAILRTDFPSFARAAFTEVHPGQHLEPTWHHEAIAAWLTESIGKKTRRFINAPPRSLKSFLVSVAWVAFVLGRWPGHKFICASYSQALANDLSSQCRKLMQSDFYKRLFATRLVKETEDELRTTDGGQRVAVSVGSTLTGLGADTIIVDDPMSANDRFSEAARERCSAWFTGNLMTRLNDKRGGAIFVVAQRLHQDDLSGLLLAWGWDGLILPAIAPCDTHFEAGDWRYFWRQGEILHAREPLDVLEQEKRQLSAFDYSAQYLQDPLPEAGNMIKRDWLKFQDQPALRQKGDQIVQSWDTAIKVTGTADYSTCLTFLVRNNNEYHVIDIWRRKVEFPGLRAAVSSEAGKHRPGAILIEDMASGSPLIAQSTADGLSGIIARRPTADKKTRMYGETSKIEAGQLILPKSAPWLDDFLAELLAFPGGKHDDQVDALSQFLNWRTETEQRTVFSADLGTVGGQPVTPSDQLGAPSPEDILYWLR
jgi:predicted phage terminase large subunit-like protein